MNRLTLMFLGLAAAMGVVGARAEDQEVLLQHNIYQTRIQPPDPETSILWEQFKDAFEQGAGDLFADQFQPLRVLNRSVNPADGDPFTFQERSARAACSSFSRSVMHGFREATVDLPLIRSFAERQELVAEFLEDSVGSVEEESVAPMDPSYRAVERSWWNRFSQTGRMRYGIRPFRTNPYAFLSLGISDGDTLILLGHVRYHYQDLANHCFEFALSVPLAPGLSVDVGTSYRVGRNDEGKGVVLKLFKEFKAGGFLHIGVEVKEHPACLAGIGFLW